MPDQSTMATTPHTVTVFPLRLMAQRQSAEMYVKHGMHLARNIGTVTSIREEYCLPPSIRTWAQLAEALRDIEEQISGQST